MGEEQCTYAHDEDGKRVEIRLYELHLPHGERLKEMEWQYYEKVTQWNAHMESLRQKRIERQQEKENKKAEQRRELWARNRAALRKYAEEKRILAYKIRTADADEENPKEKLVDLILGELF